MVGVVNRYNALAHLYLQRCILGLNGRHILAESLSAFLAEQSPSVNSLAFNGGAQTTLPNEPELIRRPHQTFFGEQNIGLTVL